MQDFQPIFDKAYAAANIAAKAVNDKLGAEQSRGFDCGFAWVTIRPARGAFVNWLKAKGLGSSAHGGGVQIWYSKCYDCNTQSVSVHEAAVAAFREVLVREGIPGTIETGSRYD